MAWPRKNNSTVDQTVIIVTKNDKFEVLNEENLYLQQLMNTT